MARTSFFAVQRKYHISRKNARLRGTSLGLRGQGTRPQHGEPYALAPHHRPEAGFVARVPAELGYLEEVGLRLPEPEFRGDGLSFVITVRSCHHPAPGARPCPTRSGRCWSGARSTSGSTAGWYAREHGSIARREYVQVTGAPERTATRDLADLVPKGLLEVAGGRGWRTAYRPRG